MMGWGYLDCQADTPAGGAELVGGQAGEGALVLHREDGDGEAAPGHALPARAAVAGHAQVAGQQPAERVIPQVDFHSILNFYFKVET